MLKAVLFDLDNTLFDFMRMKRESCAAAVEAMVDAGLGLGAAEATKLLFQLYDRYGIEHSRIFQEFLKEVSKRMGKAATLPARGAKGLEAWAAPIDHRILAEG
ncbi:MAG TPA: hypothetical protein VJB16_03305, partial [archaeon]|nr:hypothetical protein [archaeon]